MRTDVIEAIGIDESGALWVKPATATFQYIYREAMDVHWDAGRRWLHGTKPREWSYVMWFRRIKDAAHAQGVDLRIDPATIWSEVDGGLQQALTDDA